jgi:SET family sugar efflux transporter-like MFS transporter
MVAGAAHESVVSAPHRALRASSFFWGLQASLLGPLIALLLVSVYHATTSQVALALFVSSATGLWWGWLIPRRADHRLNYLAPVVASTLVAITLVTLLAFEHSTHLALFTYMALGTPAALGYSMVFAYARHLGLPPSDIVSIRSYNSMAWVLGPPLATLVLAAVGGRWVLLALGLNAVVNLSIATYLLRRHAGLHHLPTASRHVPSGADRWELAGLLASFGLLQAAISSAMNVTALYATTTLGLAAVWGGLALSFAAGLEVPVLFWLKRSANNAQEFRAVSRAAIAGIAYYAVMASASSGVEIIGLQFLNAAFVGVVVGSGLTLFQRVVGMPGAAAGLQSNAVQAGKMLVGPIVAVGANRWIGLRAVYAVDALCVLLALVALLWVRRRFERRLEGTPVAGVDAGIRKA